MSLVPSNATIANHYFIREPTKAIDIPQFTTSWSGTAGNAPADPYALCGEVGYILYVNATDPIPLPSQFDQQLFTF